MDIKNLIRDSVAKYGSEKDRIEFLPESRYNVDIFPTTGQYDWLSGQILYCLIRNIKPKKILEISTNCGYATLFMALALKENRSGIIETFELDEKFAGAAQENFKRYGVARFIKLTTGDARITSMNCEKDYDIYFLDSLHTKNFAKWFIENHVLPAAKNDSLFHMHDIMPYSARVRCWNAPPIKGSPLDLNFSLRQKANNIVKKMLGENNNAEMDEFISIKEYPPTGADRLSTFDGNRTAEAVLGNDLVKFIKDGEYIFIHDLIKEYPELEPGKYNSKVIARKDARGNPLEWNESLWCHSEAVKRAYSKLNL